MLQPMSSFLAKNRQNGKNLSASHRASIIKRASHRSGYSKHIFHNYACGVPSPSHDPMSNKGETALHQAHQREGAQS